MRRLTVLVLWLCASMPTGAAAAPPESRQPGDSRARSTSPWLRSTWKAISSRSPRTEEKPCYCRRWTRRVARPASSLIMTLESDATVDMTIPPWGSIHADWSHLISFKSRAAMMKIHSLALTVALTVSPALAAAQTSHGGHSGHSTPAQTAQAQKAPSTQGYRQANETMHRNMDIQFSGDSDVDFVRSMIPHHQGAIDMAKVALQHAKDEQIRKWATDVIREQEREIAEMQAWLKKKGVQ